MTGYSLSTSGKLSHADLGREMTIYKLFLRVFMIVAPSKLRFPFRFPNAGSI